MSMISGNKVNMDEPPLNDEIPVVLGESFFINDPQRQATFLHFRFHDKPKGMDQSRPGHIQFKDKQQCSVKFKPINDTKCDYKFNGHAKPSNDNECFLWYDSMNNRMVLEKVGLTIGPLRWDRQFVQNNMKKCKSSFQQIQDQNNDRLKNLGKKKKKKRKVTPKKQDNNNNKSNIKQQEPIANKFMDDSDSEDDRIMQKPIKKEYNTTFNNRNTNPNRHNTNQNRMIPNRNNDRNNDRNFKRTKPKNNIFSGNHKFNQHIKSNNNHMEPQGLFGDSDSENNNIINESDQDSDINNYNINNNNNTNYNTKQETSNNYISNNSNIENQNNINNINNNNNNNNEYNFDGPLPFDSSDDDDDDSDDEKLMKSINVDKKHTYIPQTSSNIPDMDDDLF